MIKFLTLLLSLLERLFSERDKNKLRQEGRQDALKEVDEALNEQLRKAEDATSTPDTARDERLRNRFDRSGGGE